MDTRPLTGIEPCYSFLHPVAVAESIERMVPVRKVGSSTPGRVESMTYKIDTCRYLAVSTNTVLSNGLVSQWPGIPVAWSPSGAALPNCHMCARSQLCTHPHDSVNIARRQNNNNDLYNSQELTHFPKNCHQAHTPLSPVTTPSTGSLLTPFGGKT